MECKNCNTELAGQEKFCAACGQKNISTLNLRYIFREILDNVFEVDSKFLRTLRYLTLKPGLLSKEYMEGKRAQYVPPIRLYIVLSVIFFFLISLIGISESSETSEQTTTESSRSGFTLNSDGIENTTLEPNVPLSGESNISFNDGGIEKTTAELKKMDYEGTLDQYLDSVTADQGFMGYFNRKSALMRVKGDTFNEVLVNQVSLFMLLFMPFFSLLYATCFSGSKRGFVGHLIFNLHLNSFILFSLCIYIFFGFFIENELVDYAFIAIVFLFGQYYLIRATMRFYDRKWWVAIYKYFLLIIGYITLAMAFMIVVVLSSMVML